MQVLERVDDVLAVEQQPASSSGVVICVAWASILLQLHADCLHALCICPLLLLLLLQVLPCLPPTTYWQKQQQTTTQGAAIFTCTCTCTPPRCCSTHHPHAAAAANMQQTSAPPRHTTSSSSSSTTTLRAHAVLQAPAWPAAGSTASTVGRASAGWCVR